MHPFDIKAALLARHAQHVVLVHFPIALTVVGVAFDFIAHFKKDRLLAAVARYNLMVAALCCLPVMATGILAWQWQLEGQRLKGTLLLHLILGSVSGALVMLTGWLHFRNHGEAAPRPRYLLPLETLGLGAVALTAHLGGFLSGVNISG